MQHLRLFFRKNSQAKHFSLRSALLWGAFLTATTATAQQPFITTWKTDNPGASNSTSITIPTTGMGYGYEVDWNNDGMYDQSSLSGDVTHDFGVAGTYTISIRGAFPRIYFNNGGDRQKLLDVGQWGNVGWTSMGNAFYGCSNLNVSATDLPNLSGVTDLSRMFQGCSILNGPANIGNWNTANVTNMGNIFTQASAFNQPIDNWNTANVTNMIGMFFQAAAFNQPIGSWHLNASVLLLAMLDNSGMDCDNYSATLIGWSANPATPSVRALGAVGRQYGTNAVAARTNLDITKGWTISGDMASGVACPAPLPVEWLAFNGKWQANGVLLQWQTAGEQQHRGFHVERSPDGLGWTDIGFVAGKGAAAEAQHYSFLDEKPLPGTNYYRLRQMDSNGRETFSKAVSIDMPSLKDLAYLVRVFPNPVANGELHLLLPENTEEEITVQLFSPAGQLLRTMLPRSGDNTWQVHELPAGLYVLHIRSGAGNSFQKIVVEH